MAPLKNMAHRPKASVPSASIPASLSFGDARLGGGSIFKFDLLVLCQTLPGMFKNMHALDDFF